MKIKWREDGLRCTSDDNRRGPLYGQFMAGDVIDEIHHAVGFIDDAYWEFARIAHAVADGYMKMMVHQ